jgi:NAD(P)-dependent dehydrogenase (short-subunit alcohol dehydrogenase family)
MSIDQYTRQDPTTQYPQPSGKGQEIAHPGRTQDMDGEPDHGEKTYRGSGRLTDRRAVITGGDSGIGRAVALAFAREGADVLITHLPEERADAEATLKLITDAGQQGVAVEVDLRTEDECRRLVERAVKEFGRIDVLVNNAAYQMSQPGGIADITTEQFERTMKTNIYAMFWLCKFAAPHMEPGASIINTASIQGFNPSPHLLDYATTKGAIVNFTKGLGQQLIEQGIRVNAVAPGPVWTPLIPATMDAEKVADFGAQAPIGRAAQPAEIAPAFVFFASQESSFITAEVLGVTGGTPLT